MKLRIIAAMLVLGLAAAGLYGQERLYAQENGAKNKADEEAVDGEENESTVDEELPADDEEAGEGGSEEVESGETAESGDTSELETLEQKAAYAIGLSVGTNIKRQGIDVDKDLLIQGIRDALSGDKPLLTEEEASKALNEFGKIAQKQQESRAKKLGDSNQTEGEEFLAANRKKKGVKTTKSGLQYRVLKKGNGKTPKLSDTVTTHYKGTLIDGTEFDSSYSRGEPASFPVKGVIAGWTEALQLMTEGSKWELVIPAKLAYGERGAGADIGPNATLIFQIELISVD